MSRYFFLFVQLEHCQKCHLCAKCRRFAAVALRNACLRASVRGNLHAAQGPHLLFAPPDVPSGGDPIFYLRGGSEFRLRQGFRSGKNTCTAHCAAPRCGAPGKMKMPVYSSNLSTARNASVGICTLPRDRIFFLPHRMFHPVGTPFFTCAAEVNSACAKVFAPAKTLVRRIAPPRAAGPRAK